MAAEATTFAEGNSIDITPVAAVAAGEMIQLADGRAAWAPTAIAAGVEGAVQVKGIVKLLKTTSMVFLKGGRIFWDASASKTHFKKVNDRDYYCGRAHLDAASADTVCYVNLNIDPPYDIKMNRDAFLSVPTGTKAAGAFGYPKPLGGSQVLELTATNEAQCIDMLSVDRFAIASNPIAEFIFRPDVNGTGSTVDFNIGMADGTSTTDADAIVASCFIHIDGGSVNILAESDDGTASEVAATDTTIDITAGVAVANRVEVWMDARDPADIQIYIDGVLMLGSTVFTVAGATGPLGLLAHLEKSTGTETGRFTIDEMRVRLMEQ